MSFIEHWGRLAGVKQISILPGDESPGRDVQVLAGIVRDDEVDFEVGTPVFEGDQLEWEDPRGGKRKVFVTSVEMREPPIASEFMRHWAAHYSSKAPLSASSSHRSGGHTIVVNGSNVNIAIEGSTITQQLPVSGGYEGLADAVGRALALIEETKGVDAEEADAARESATLLLAETTKPEPDRKQIKRLILVLKGVLTSAANAGAGAAATGLIGQLFVAG